MQNYLALFDDSTGLAQAAGSPVFSDLQPGRSEPYGSTASQHLNPGFGLTLDLQRTATTTPPPPSSSVYLILPEPAMATAVMTLAVQFDTAAGTFSSPSPETPGPNAQWAVGLTFKTGDANEVEGDDDRAGVTCQFTDQGARLNFPNSPEPPSDILDTYGAIPRGGPGRTYWLEFEFFRNGEAGAPATGTARLTVDGLAHVIPNLTFPSFLNGDDAKLITAVGVGVSIKGQLLGSVSVALHTFLFVTSDTFPYALPLGSRIAQREA